MATTPEKATVPRVLIVEREYEPSRLTRRVMASSYEILVPVVGVTLRGPRRAASETDTGQPWEAMVVSGGQR